MYEVCRHCWLENRLWVSPCFPVQVLSFGLQEILGGYRCSLKLFLYQIGMCVFISLTSVPIFLARLDLFLKSCRTLWIKLFFIPKGPYWDLGSNKVLRLCGVTGNLLVNNMGKLVLELHHCHDGTWLWMGKRYWKGNDEALKAECNKREP